MPGKPRGAAGRFDLEHKALQLSPPRRWITGGDAALAHPADLRYKNALSHSPGHLLAQPCCLPEWVKRSFWKSSETEGKELGAPGGLASCISAQQQIAAEPPWRRQHVFSSDACTDLSRPAAAVLPGAEQSVELGMKGFQIGNPLLRPLPEGSNSLQQD